MPKDIEYAQYAKAKIQDKRSIVISSCSKGGFTIAQQLEVEEGPRFTSVFLKGAFHVDNVEGLINIRDALNTAIAELAPNASKEQEDNDWDDIDK